MNQALILITTEPNKKNAKNLAKLLVKKKLAACVSLKNIDSIYEWQGIIEECKEVPASNKSRPKLKNDLILFF